MFHNIWDNPSHWRTRIFQDGYCTTNQISSMAVFLESHRTNLWPAYSNYCEPPSAPGHALLWWNGRSMLKWLKSGISGICISTITIQNTCRYPIKYKCRSKCKYKCKYKCNYNYNYKHILYTYRHSLSTPVQVMFGHVNLYHPHELDVPLCPNDYHNYHPNYP